MDPRDFDRLTRAAAGGLSRRGVLGWLGGGAAALLGGASLARQAEAASQPGALGSCTLHLTGDIRLGPSLKQRLTPKSAKAGELKGDLSFTADAKGAITNGLLVLADGTRYPANGQIDGAAINLRVAVAKDRVVILVGTAARDLGVCSGGVDGLLTGPQPGDLGDWHATAVPTPATLTGTTGGAPAAPPTTAAPAGGGCATGKTSCGGTCVDTQSDPNNCGACGTVCPANQSCIAGACLQTGCPAGQVSCSADKADCADLSRDPNNCGACGTACAADEGCCAGVCLSLLNESNCGACGVVCAQDRSCENGKCVAANACPDGTVCGGVCTDLTSDPNNCGACGTTCAAGQACLNGACTAACPNGQQVCGQVCVDITADPNNCGDCGIACGDNQTCINFVCCDNTNICNGVCVGPASPANCGGNCIACAQGQICCVGTGGCVDFQTDSNNCGNCGVACGQGQTCVNGACG